MRYAFQILVAFALASCTRDAAPAAPDLGVPPDLGVRCDADDACDDDDPCTRDRCVAGRCVIDRAPEPPLEVEGVVPAARLTGLALADDRLLLTRVDDEGSAVEVWDLAPLPAAMQLLDRAAEVDDGDFMGVLPLGERMVVFETPARLRLLGADGASVGLYRASDPVQAARALDDRRVLAAVFGKGLEVVDFGDPASPARAVRVDTVGRALDVALAGRYWLVADGLAGVGLVNPRTDPPRRVDGGELPTDGRVVAIDAAYGVAVTAELGAGLGVIDVLADLGPARVGLLPLDGVVRDVAFVAPGLAAAATDAGLVLVDLLRPSVPVVWGAPVGEAASRIEARDGRVAVARAGGVELYRLSCAVPVPDAGDAGVDAGASSDAGE